MSSAEEAIAKAEVLLGRLEAKLAELERIAEADELDGDAAVEVISELAALAKEIEAELTRARAIADADA